MPSALRRLVAVLGALAAAVSVAACRADAGPAEPVGGFAIVLGARANMPPVDDLQGVARQAVNNALDNRSRMALVVADGAPFVLEDPQSNGDTAGGTSRYTERTIQTALATAAARTPEADLLAALDVAARAIESAPEPRTVLIVDSGLSTAGAVDFRRPGLLDADPADLVASLEAAGALPDLGGVHVVFQGLGSTAEPQPAVGASERRQLEELWTAVALASGALDVNVEDAPLTGEPDPGLPAVSAVGTGVGVSCTENTVVLDGGDVAFTADTSVFKDSVAASATLQPIADTMTAAGVSATLTGTTANVGDIDGQRRLSRERAQAVADLLAALGVPTGSMTVVGLGSDFPGYVQDRDVQGNLLPAAAALNRKVVIELSGATRAVTCE